MQRLSQAPAPLVGERGALSRRDEDERDQCGRNHSICLCVYCRGVREDRFRVWSGVWRVGGSSRCPAVGPAQECACGRPHECRHRAHGRLATSTNIMQTVERA